MQTTWALLSLIIPGISAFIVCRCLGEWGSQAVNLLVALVVYVVLFLIPIHIIATLELLGLFDAFSLFYIAIFDVFILLSLLMWRHLTPGVTSSRYEKSSLTSYLRTMPKYVVISLGIVAVCYFTFAFDLFTSYPQGPDGIYYRLPVAVGWLQDGSLRIPPAVPDADFNWHYSQIGNGEIPMMVLLSVGWHALAILFNFISVIILVCSVYLIALKCGTSRVSALICALILASVPIVTFQSFYAYTDVYAAGFFMAAVVLFLYRHNTPQTTKPNRFLLSIILSGLACGIAVGAKTPYYLYGSGFFIVVLITVVIESRQHGKSPVLPVTLMLVAILVPSIFWFGRGFFTTGNPFYPIKVEILGHTIFDGYRLSFMRPKTEYLHFVRTQAEWFIYPWTEYNNRRFNYSVDSGVGASFATFVPLGVFYVIYTLFRNRSQNSIKGILTLSLFVGLIAWWFVMGQGPRFGVPLIAIACILSTPLIDLFLPSRARLFGMLLVCAVATTCVISSSLPLRATLKRMHRGEWTRSEIYHYPPLIDNLPAGSTVLNLSHLYMSNFGLAGKHLSNRVITMFQLPVYRWKADHPYYRPFDISQDFLSKNKVDYIVQRKGDYLPEIVQRKGDNLPEKDRDFIDDRPYPKYVVPSLQLELIYDEAKELTVPIEHPWRVWKVIRERESNSFLENSQ